MSHPPPHIIASLMNQPVMSVLGRSALSAGVSWIPILDEATTRIVPDSILRMTVDVMPELVRLRWRSPLRYGRIARDSIEKMNTEIERLEQLVGDVEPKAPLPPQIRFIKFTGSPVITVTLDD